MAIYFPNSELGEVCCETWRITSHFTGDNNLMGGNSLINWEKSDDVYGTGNDTSILSHSNGQFTFGKYGWFLVHFFGYFYYSDNSRWNELQLYVSWNSGANWDYHTIATSHMSPNTSNNYNQSCSGSSIVLGNANARLRFGVNVENNSVTTYGTTNENYTGFTIIKVSEA